MLETAPSDVASRFPRNCRASQPVSKPWKLLKFRFPQGGGRFLHVFLHVFFILTSLKFHSLLLLLSESCTVRDGFLQYSTEPLTVNPDCFVGVSAKSGFSALREGGLRWRLQLRTLAEVGPWLSFFSVPSTSILVNLNLVHD